MIDGSASTRIECIQSSSPPLALEIYAPLPKCTTKFAHHSHYYFISAQPSRLPSKSFEYNRLFYHATLIALIQQMTTIKKSALLVSTINAYSLFISSNDHCGLGFANFARIPDGRVSLPCLLLVDPGSNGGFEERA